MAGPIKNLDNATMWAVVVMLRAHNAGMGPARHSKEEAREKQSAKLLFSAEHTQTQQGKQKQHAGEVRGPSHSRPGFRCGQR